MDVAISWNDERALANIEVR